ncbi:hypothetical protein [Peijinzhouia sedimentorum]
MSRQTDGRETWHRLINWDKGQSPSEKLSAQILIYEKYVSIDPSHPLGGQDGKKDILCKKGNTKFVAGCYFPRGQKNFSEIKTKFKEDAEGIESNSVDGIIFITNQELRLGEREELKKEIDDKYDVEIYHLERIAAILNHTENYGVRLEFLDIDMTKEEQLAYMVTKDKIIHDLTSFVRQLAPNSNIHQEEAPKPAIEVQLEYIPSSSLSLAWHNKPYHKCSYCKYGFKIAGSGLDYYSYVAHHGISGTKLITCPKCGNTEEHFGI